MPNMSEELRNFLIDAQSRYGIETNPDSMTIEQLVYYKEKIAGLNGTWINCFEKGKKGYFLKAEKPATEHEIIDDTVRKAINTEAIPLCNGWNSLPIDVAYKIATFKVITKALNIDGIIPDDANPVENVKLIGENGREHKAFILPFRIRKDISFRGVNLFGLDRTDEQGNHYLEKPDEYYSHLLKNRDEEFSGIALFEPTKEQQELFDEESKDDNNFIQLWCVVETANEQESEDSEKNVIYCSVNTPVDEPKNRNSFSDISRTPLYIRATRTDGKYEMIPFDLISAVNSKSGKSAILSLLVDIIVRGENVQKNAEMMLRTFTEPEVNSKAITEYEDYCELCSILRILNKSNIAPSDRCSVLRTPDSRTLASFYITPDLFIGEGEKKRNLFNIPSNRDTPAKKIKAFNETVCKGSRIPVDDALADCLSNRARQHNIHLTVDLLDRTAGAWNNYSLLVSTDENGNTVRYRATLGRNNGNRYVTLRMLLAGIVRGGNTDENTGALLKFFYADGDSDAWTDKAPTSNYSQYIDRGLMPTFDNSGTKNLVDFVSNHKFQLVEYSWNEGKAVCQITEIYAINPINGEKMDVPKLIKLQEEQSKEDAKSKGINIRESNLDALLVFTFTNVRYALARWIREHASIRTDENNRVQITIEPCPIKQIVKMSCLTIKDNAQISSDSEPWKRVVRALRILTAMRWSVMQTDTKLTEYLKSEQGKKVVEQNAILSNLLDILETKKQVVDVTMFPFRLDEINQQVIFNRIQDESLLLFQLPEAVGKAFNLDKKYIPTLPRTKSTNRNDVLLEAYLIRIQNISESTNVANSHSNEINIDNLLNEAGLNPNNDPIIRRDCIEFLNDVNECLVAEGIVEEVELSRFKRLPVKYTVIANPDSKRALAEGQLAARKEGWKRARKRARKTKG